jgi:hypothetical protein
LKAADQCLVTGRRTILVISQKELARSAWF